MSDIHENDKNVGAESVLFASACAVPRPVRLSAKTRAYAYETQMGKYGDEAMTHKDVEMDTVPGFESLGDFDKYNKIMLKIANEAPLRVCEAERVSGAATLGAALSHVVPASFGGECLFQSMSHVTLGFDRAVRIGIDAMEREIAERLSSCDDERGSSLLNSMLVSVEAMRIWHRRYLKALAGIPGKEDILKDLEKVPFSPAESFSEAIRSLWFNFAFTRLCGNWSGIGRIDELLGPYLEKDLAEGKITLGEARELVAGFMIKGGEWIRGEQNRGTGDSQNYQNIVLGGVGADGRSIVNTLTYLVLEVVEELGISDFPIAVRVNKETPEKLLRKCGEVIRHGGGIVAVYNEDLILASLTDYGYPVEEARRFANDGCWEVQIPGKTNFGYFPFDSLAVFQQEVMRQAENNAPEYASFEELYESFRLSLARKVDSIVRGYISATFDKKDGEYIPKQALLCPIISFYTDGCVRNAKAYTEGGATYNVRSPHIGGAPDVANALYAIKKVVYDEKKLSFGELWSIVKNNWENAEPLRQYILNKYSYFGNDNDEVDEIAARIIADFAAMTREIDKEAPLFVIPGISTFGRQIDWLPSREASPHGRKKGDILAGNFSPTPGSDSHGATAIIKSYCKTDMKEITCGAALDIRLMPSAVNGNDGVSGIESLIRGFCSLGGFFMQIDVADNAVLLAAREHPENYKSLAVRVSGWSARFVTLCDEWQQMVIERSAQGL